MILHKLKILVVDDNVDLAESLATILRLDGHTVAVAFEGRESLKLARDWQPHVVLLDIGLPDMDGFQVAHHLSSDPESRLLTLVACTAYDGNDTKERAKQAGFDHYLVKPIDWQKLSTILASLLPHGGVA